MKRTRKVKKAVTILLCTLLVATGIFFPENRVNAGSAVDEQIQGKVYKITPNSKPVKGSAINQFTTINKNTLNYYTIRSYMEKFEKDKKGTLVLKKGTYNLTNTIFVPSNVTIILEDGVVINKSMNTGTGKFPAATSMFQLIRPSKAAKTRVYGGHNGEKNIHFVGKGSACIDLKYVKTSIGIIMGHNQNVTIEGISFKNMNDGHFIEMDASKNVKVSNCNFANAKKGSDYVKEAINIDTPDKETKGFSLPWSKFDKTPNENVTISSSTFTNMGRAIGTHKYSAKGSQQQYHTNIVIKNNRITNMKKDAPVRMMNWKNAVVSENQIIKVKETNKSDTRGILASGCINPNISNNYFEQVGRAIQFIAWKNTGDGSGYPVTKNKLSSANKKSLATNRGKKLGLKEYYVRICPKYNYFLNPETVVIIKEE
ncbi:MAG: hypothetical protein SOT70_02675 [Lachnospiraceae bacterium]|nr:hypothetical protein [Lachnospiraceae bacterium]